MKIYVASSWRNPYQQGVVKVLRRAGHEVYDFRNPGDGDRGFDWSEIDPEWRDWTPEQYREQLHHPLAEDGFAKAMDALRDCEACLLVQPCGLSAHLELGWAEGAGKGTIVLLKPGEPELMYKMVDVLCTSIEEVVDVLECLAKMKYRMVEGGVVSSPFPDGAQVLTLPVPPSSNRYWRTTARYSRAQNQWRAVTYKSAEAKEYQQSAKNFALAAGMRPLPDPTEVTLIVVWYREKRMGDLTNRIKVVEDALQGAAYDDDKQVCEVHEYRFDTERHKPRLEICVQPKGNIQESAL